MVRHALPTKSIPLASHQCILDQMGSLKDFCLKPSHGSMQINSNLGFTCQSNILESNEKDLLLAKRLRGASHGKR